MATYMLTGVDDELWRRFKASCDLQGITVKDFFLDCINSSVKVMIQEFNYHKAEDHKPNKGGKNT